MRIVSTLLLIICCSSSVFGQGNQNAQNKFMEHLEWVNTHPSQKSDGEFVYRLSEMIKFQYSNYPDFVTDINGLSEFIEIGKMYRYFDYISTVYTFNQVAYKLQHEEDFDKISASFYAMQKVLKTYQFILAVDPLLNIKVFDSYMQMENSRLRDHLASLMSE